VNKSCSKTRPNGKTEIEIKWPLAENALRFTKEERNYRILSVMQTLIRQSLCRSLCQLNFSDVHATVRYFENRRVTEHAEAGNDLYAL